MYNYQMGFFREILEQSGQGWPASAVLRTTSQVCDGPESDPQSSST